MSLTRAISRYRKPLLYFLLLTAVVILWVWQGFFFDFELAERMVQGGLFLQLLGVGMAGYGIYKVLLDYGEIFTREVLLKPEDVTLHHTMTEPDLTVDNGDSPEVKEPVEDRVKKLEEWKVELKEKCSRRAKEIRNELEQLEDRVGKGISELKREQKKNLKETQIKNLGLEIAGFLLILAGVILRFSATFFG